MRSPKQWLEDAISNGVFMYLASCEDNDELPPVEMGVCIAVENYLDDHGDEILWRFRKRAQQ